jgi:hypothetical protein
MDLNTLQEYIKIYIISLKQDIENEDGADSIVPYLEGCIDACQHILKVIDER